MPTKRMPIIALVGRPNTGKSTMFNRLVGERKALVHELPGMTRDRHYGRGEHAGRPFVVIDTGGYEDTTDSPLLALMREQTMIAIDEADRVIMLAEQAVPNDPIDAEIVEKLRAAKKPFFLAVNKADDHGRENQAIADFSVHGLDNVYPVSALHGAGVYELLDAVTEGFEEFDPKEDRRRGPIRVAIVGRQNAGKSTLTNLLVGQNRVIASPVAGTTRDSIDTEVTVDGQEFTIIDTAGIRRRGRIERGAEKLSVHSAFTAIDRCDVALLMIDAAEGITAQDTHIAGYLVEAGKACVIVLNKWDAVADRQNYGKYIRQVREDFSFLKWAPVLTISAKTGQRAYKLWGLIRHCAAQYRREFGTRELNEVLARTAGHLSPPVTGGKALKIKYVTQTGFCPPKLTFFVNDPGLLHFSYERYLQNQFRAWLKIDGTPLKFYMKRKAEEENWLKANRKGGPEVPPEELLGEEDLEPIEIDIDDAEMPLGEDEDFEAPDYREEDGLEEFGDDEDGDFADGDDEDIEGEDNEEEDEQ